MHFACHFFLHQAFYDMIFYLLIFKGKKLLLFIESKRGEPLTHSCLVLSHLSPNSLPIVYCGDQSTLTQNNEKNGAQWKKLTVVRTSNLYQKRSMESVQ